MSLNVSMIVIGDEILNGRTKDLNASWLSSFLFSSGLNLLSVRFIKDDKKTLIPETDFEANYKLKNELSINELKWETEDIEVFLKEGSKLKKEQLFELIKTFYIIYYYVFYLYNK